MEDFNDYKSRIKYYDIESYWSHFFLMVKNEDKEIEHVFMVGDTDLKEYQGVEINHNKRDLVKWADENIICAYNGYGYDDYMIHYIKENLYCNAHMLKNYSNFIINEHKKDDFKDRRLPFIAEKIHSLDAKQEINSDRKSGISLKHIQSNMGKEIWESSVDFDRKEPLTDEELIKELDYNSNDVDTLIDVMQTPQRQRYYETKSGLVQMVIDKYNEPLYYNERSAEYRRGYWNLIKQTVGGLVAYLWEGIPDTPITWDFDVPDEVFDTWRADWAKPKDRRKVRMELADNFVDFGYGGIHGVHKYQKIFKKLFHIDVGSMYPSLIINHEILGKFTEQYKQMKIDRIKFKHSTEEFYKALADIYKLILNTSYGKLLEKNSKCKNIPGGIHTCFRGQEALWNLGIILEPYGTIAQFNTDGIYFKPHKDDEEFTKIWMAKKEMWEDEFDLDLDVDPVELLIQRDVNNYLAIEEGKVVSKGEIGKISLESEFDLYHPTHRFVDNLIINKAVSNYLLYDIPLIDTICNPDEDIRLYCTTFKVSNAYMGLAKGFKGEILKGGVNRILNTTDGEEYFKVKEMEETIASFKSKNKAGNKVGDMIEINGGKTNYVGIITGLDDKYIYYGKNEKVAISSKYMEAGTLKREVGDVVTDSKGVERVVKNIWQNDDDEVEIEWESQGETFIKKAVKADYNLVFNYEVGDVITVDKVFKEKFEIVEITEDRIFYKKPKRLSYQKVTNVSSSADLINGNIEGMSVKDFDVNFDFYLGLAQKTLRGWL